MSPDHSNWITGLEESTIHLKQILLTKPSYKQTFQCLPMANARIVEALRVR